MQGVVKTTRTEKEYRKIDCYSSSDLRDFLKDKRKFYKQNILGEILKKSEYRKGEFMGSLVHCIMLEPHTFDDNYFMSSVMNVPGGMMLDFVQSLNRLVGESVDENGVVTGDFVEMATKAKEESGYKITLEAVLKKFKESGEDYFNQLRECSLKDLTVITVDDMNIAHKIIEMLREDPNVGPILADYTSDSIEIFNELKVESFEIEGITMKAMLDKVVVDYKNKTLQPYDLKVLYENQDFFRNYYLKTYCYIPAYVYNMALEAVKEELNPEFKDFKVLAPIFIVADSGCFNRPLLYKISEKSLGDARDGFTYNNKYYAGVKEVIKDIKWSEETGIWNIPRSVFDNNGVIEI